MCISSISSGFYSSAFCTSDIFRHYLQFLGIKIEEKMLKKVKFFYVPPRESIKKKFFLFSNFFLILGGPFWCLTFWIIVRKVGKHKNYKVYKHTSDFFSKNEGERKEKCHNGWIVPYQSTILFFFAFFINPGHPHLYNIGTVGRNRHCSSG